MAFIKNPDGTITVGIIPVKKPELEIPKEERVEPEKKKPGRKPKQ